MSLSNEKSTKIYGIKDGDGIIRYVGKTINNIEIRFNCHRNSKSNVPVSKWLRTHRKEATVVLIETTCEDWKEREQFWIRHYLEICPKRFLNVLKGGEGAHFIARTKEHQEKIVSKLRNGKLKPCEECEKDMYVSPAFFKRRFCSRECRTHWERKNRIWPSIPIPLQAVEKAAALKRAKMICIRGHNLFGDNIRIDKKGGRICRECSRLAVAKSRKKLAGERGGRTANTS